MSHHEQSFELVYNGPDKDDPNRTFSEEGMSQIGRLFGRFVGGQVMSRLLMGRGPKWMRVSVKVEFEPQPSDAQVVQVFDGERRSAAPGVKHG